MVETESADDRFTFPTASGMELECRPVSRIFLQRAAATVPLPPGPPTYETKTGPGDVQLHEHDENTIRDKDRATDEDREAWDAHLEGKAQYVIDWNHAFTRAAVVMGVITDPPEDDEWLRLQQIACPELIPDIETIDEADKKVVWVCTVALLDQVEIDVLIQRLIAKSEAAAVALKEERRAWRAIFRYPK